MLTNLRERSQRSFGVLILFGMLTFIFIFFFGPQSEGCQPQQANVSLDGWAARINGVELERREVENLVYLRGNRRTDDELASLRQDILVGLIDQELLAQRAIAVGINIDEKGLSRYITSDENPDFVAFTDDAGNFDRDGFRDALRYRLGISPEDYRTRKRREFLANQYRRFMEEQIQVSDTEVQLEIEKDLRSWNLDYLKFAPETFAITAPTASDVEQYAKAEDKSIKAFYEKNKSARFVKGREVEYRRILIKKPAKEAPNYDQALKTAREKIEKLHTQATSAGADFEALATEHSEGQGDSGWARPGVPFYKDVFEPLKVGEVSAIQDDQIGLFFVKAKAEKPAVNRTLDSATTEIAQELLSNKLKADAAKAAASDALSRIRAGATLADSIKTGTSETDEAAEVEAGEQAKTDRVATQVGQIAETGPIADNSRFGQPWDRIPTLGKRSLGARSEVVARALRTLSKDKPLLDDVVEIEGEFYIFSLKSQTNGTKEQIADKMDEKRTQLLALRKRQMVYGEISGLGGDPLSNFRKAIRIGNKVEINEELYPQPKAAQNPTIPPIQLKLGGDQKK
ncbi:MAG: peptidylprolyl isomerase [Bradymonadia bacterium]